MALSPNSVVASIKALQVDGLTIRGLDDVADEVFARDCPVMQPRLVDFLTNFSLTRETFGEYDKAMMRARYRLNFTVFFSEVGEGRGMYEQLDGLLTIWGKTLDAFITTRTLGNTAVLDNIPENPELSIVMDAVGNQFAGFHLPINIMEFVNAERP